jgi:hypothetical protein
MPCPQIGLTQLRQSDLRGFLRGILAAQDVLAMGQIYGAVLKHFGESTCSPSINCPHYEEAHPEFHHVVRWTLQDGKTAGEFENGPRGQWRVMHPGGPR